MKKKNKSNTITKKPQLSSKEEKLKKLEEINEECNKHIEAMNKIDEEIENYIDSLDDQKFKILKDAMRTP